ncbi:MAG: hypothetical protein ACOC2D_06070 [Spirochaetota bacterium]
MQRLTRNGFARAAEFLAREARPLERALFAFRFTGADAGPVREALAAYRNPDGGFGRALEPDVRTPASSAYLTAIALTTLAEIGATQDDELVAGAARHLAAAYDRGGMVWPILPPEAQAAPRAPWWNDRGGEGPFRRLSETFDGFRIIPRARIVDGLVRLGAGESIPEFAPLLHDTLATIAEAGTDALGGGGGAFVDAACLATNPALTNGAATGGGVSVADATGAPESARTAELVRAARENLARRLPDLVETRPEAWSSYSAGPVKLLAEPSPLAGASLAPAIDAHLDYLVDRQTADGSWEPNWTWMGEYPQEWERARAEWKSIVTLETLTSLRAYARIES